MPYAVSRPAVGQQGRLYKARPDHETPFAFKAEQAHPFPTLADAQAVAKHLNGRRLGDSPAWTTEEI